MEYMTNNFIFLWLVEGYMETILIGEDCSYVSVPPYFGHYYVLFLHIHKSSWIKKKSLGNIELSTPKQRKTWKYDYTELNFRQQIFLLLLFKEEYPKPEFHR